MTAPKSVRLIAVCDGAALLIATVGEDQCDSTSGAAGERGDDAAKECLSYLIGPGWLLPIATGLQPSRGRTHQREI